MPGNPSNRTAPPARIRVPPPFSPAAPAEAVNADDRAPAKTIVRPVANAIGILRYLGHARKPCTATQVARQLSINTSTCFNILRTLVMEGVVEFDEVSKTYKVGLGLMKLVKSVFSEEEHVAAVKPFMHQVAEAFEVTMVLWRRIGADRMMLVAVESGSRDMRIHVNVGQRLPLLIGATGRSMLGSLGLTEAAAGAAFQSLRWSRPLSFETYWRDAQKAAERGWAVDDGYFSAGTTTVATPVFDLSGVPRYSLSALSFRGQLDKPAIERLGAEMVPLARRMTAILF